MTGVSAGFFQTKKMIELAHPCPIFNRLAL
jgi:hypothetical protein